MKVRVNYEVGIARMEDSIILEGDTPEEIRTKAIEEVTKRGGSVDSCWSEVIE